VPTTVVPTKIWDDSGSGGGKPGSIWTVNSMDMMCVTAGHDRPTEVFYDINVQNLSLVGLLAVGNNNSSR
jgi:hypothetical protein